MTRAYPSMMGTRLRTIRQAHGTSIRVLAEVVGTSAAYLSQVESGRRALDRHSTMLALAYALGTMPDVFTAPPFPAPANGGIDSAIEAVRRAVLDVHHQRPGGQLAAPDALQARTTATVHAHRGGKRPDEVGVAIAELIRDLHISIEAGGDTTLLELAVRFHAHATLGWLHVVSAPVDLRLQVANLAYRGAQDLGTPAALGLAAWGGLSAMISAGLVDLAQAELDAIDVPTTSPESLQLAGTLTLARALLAAVDSRSADAAAMFDEAARLAEHTGEDDAFEMGFGPTIVALWRMYGMLEAGDYKRVAHIGAALHPLDHLCPLWQADYWVTYGRALARLQSRRHHAAHALRRAEEICPHRVYRDSFARDLITELLARSWGDTADRDLHDLARRAGVVSE